MTAPRPASFCPRCGAEVPAALPLCPGCGVLLSTPLGATVLRPEGFGAEPTSAATSGTLEVAALAPAPLEPTPVPPAVASMPVPASPPAGGKKRRRKAKAPVAEEEAFARYGLAAPTVVVAPAAEVPPPVAPYPPAVDAAPTYYPPQPPMTHAPPGYVVVPPSRGGTAAKPVAGEPKVSALAIVAFILAFACFPLGLVLSLVAFARIKASKGKLRGEWLAVLGVIISVLLIIMWSIGSQKKPTKPRRAAVTLTLPVA